MILLQDFLLRNYCMPSICSFKHETVVLLFDLSLLRFLCKWSLLSFHIFHVYWIIEHPLHEIALYVLESYTVFSVFCWCGFNNLTVQQNCCLLWYNHNTPQRMNILNLWRSSLAAFHTNLSYLIQMRMSYCPQNNTIQRKTYFMELNMVVLIIYNTY